MKTPRAICGTLLVQTLGVFWRATKVELRYVPMAVKVEQNNERHVLLVAMLVIAQGRFTQSSMLGRRSREGAAVLPLQRNGVSLRLVTESKATTTPFSFSLEWVRSATDREPEATTQISFRAENACEYARWKQSLGVAIAMPLVGIKLPVHKASMTLAIAVDTLECEPEKTDEDESRSPQLIDELIERADASVLNQTDALAIRVIGDLIDGVEDSYNDTNDHETLDEPGDSDAESNEEYDSVLALQSDDSDTSVFELNMTSAVTADPSHDQDQLSKAAPVYLKSPTALPTLRTANKLCPLDSATPVSTTMRVHNAATTKESTTQSIQEQAVKVAEDDDTIQTASICVEAIVKHFEVCSWPSSKFPGDYNTPPRDLRRQLSLTVSHHAKRHWKSANSMPNTLTSNLFDKSEGYSWRIAPPSLLQRERCERIRKANNEVERRVRALVRPQPLEEVAEPCCWPALLPRLIVNPLSPPPSLRSTFDEFCCL